MRLCSFKLKTCQKIHKWRTTN